MKKLIESKKSVLAFALTLAVLITMIPVGVFADSYQFHLECKNTNLAGEVIGQYEIAAGGEVVLPTKTSIWTEKFDTRDIAPGQIVTITASALEGVDAKLSFFEIGYVKDGQYTIDEPSPTYKDEELGIEVYEFTMPNSNVDIFMDFIAKEDENVHQIVVGEMEHGSVDVRVLVTDEFSVQELEVTRGGKAHSGSTVQIKVKPASVGGVEYRLDDISVDRYNPEDESCNPFSHYIVPQRVAKTTDTYIFTMPDNAVQINVSYVPGPTFAPRDAVSINVGGSYATDRIPSADKGAYTIEDTFDKVNFAGKTWYVISNDTSKHRMVLLSDSVVEGAAVAQTGLDAALAEFENTITATTADAAALVGNPFALSINDLNNCRIYEDQVAFGASWWLADSNTYVSADGILVTEAAAEMTANVRPAVVIDTTKVVLVYHSSVTASSNYVKPNTDIVGRPGQAWTFVMHDTTKDVFNYRSAYRTINKSTVTPTDDMEVVVKDAGAADKLVIVRNGSVQYWGKYSSVDNSIYKYNGVLSHYKSGDKLYVFQGSDNNYTSEKYEVLLHEHQFKYVSHVDGATGETVVELRCVTNDGSKCLFNEDELPQAYMKLSDPDFGVDLFFDNTFRAITENHGTSFMPEDFGFGSDKVSVTYYDDNNEDAETATDWFYGNGAANVGNAPKEDGKYHAIVHFPSTTAIAESLDARIDFDINTEVYKIYVDTTDCNGTGTAVYSHDDATAIADDNHTTGGRPHAGSTLTVTVSAGAWNGWVVDGLEVRTKAGDIVATFDAVEYGTTGTAVSTYTLTMPAAHIVLKPLFKEHTHIWSTEWTSTAGVDGAHWHDCLAANCTTGAVGKVSSRAAYDVHHWSTTYTSVDTAQHKRVCSDCGIELLEDHTFLNIKENYCSDESIHWVVCTAEGCNATGCAATISAAHSWKLTSDAGMHWYECEVCGRHKDDTQHEYNIVINDSNHCVQKETCTHEGIYFKKCTCGAVATDASVAANTSTVAALAHTTSGAWEHDDTNHYYVCTDCGTYVNTQAHSWVEIKDDKYLVNAKVDNCVAQQDYYKVCSVCGATASGVTFTTGGAHSLSSTFSSDEVNHWIQCTNCSYKTSIASHNAISMTAAATAYKKELATCTHGTIYYQSCGDCGRILTSTFEAVDEIAEHVLTEVKNASTKAINATCTQDAVYYKTCSKCNQVITGATFSALNTRLGHDENGGTTIAGVSNPAEGHYTVCSRCGSVNNGILYYHNFGSGYTTGSATTTVSVSTTVALTAKEITVTIPAVATFDLSGGETVTKAVILTTTVAITGSGTTTVSITEELKFEYHKAECQSGCGYSTGIEEHYTADYHTENLARCNRLAICDLCREFYGEVDPDRHTVGEYPNDYNRNETQHQPKRTCDHKDENWHNHRWLSKTIGENNPWYDIWYGRAIVADPGTCSPGSVTTYYEYCIDCNYGREGYDGARATSTFALSSSETHNFVATAAGAVLKTTATCFAPAEYWCVCEHCGKLGTQQINDGEDYFGEVRTFTSGEALGHNKEFKGSDESKHRFYCNRCNDFYDENHSYTLQSAETKYLVSAATCATAASYYYYCECGVTKAGCTYTSGAAASHSFTVLGYDENNHWYKCEWCDVTSGTAAHTSNTTPATCQMQGVCDVCGQAYGTTSGAHDWNYSTVTSTDEAVHYYKCKHCDATTTSAHDYSNTWVTNGEAHWKKCVSCDAITAYAVHYGGTSTCAVQATCAACGTPYGDKPAHDFDTSKWITDGDNHWHKCVSCDAITASAAHTYADIVKNEYRISGPTCTLDALYNKSCSVCGVTSSATFRSDTATEDKATGHTYKYDGNQSTTTQAVYVCSDCGVKVTITLKTVDGKSQYVYNTTAQRKATLEAVYDNDYTKLTLPEITYSEDVTNAGIVTATATSGSEFTLTLTYEIIRAEQSGFQLGDMNYTYEDSTLPATTVSGLKENPGVTYFYRASGTGADVWKSWDVTTTTALTPGGYEMYATVAQIRNYNATQTAVKQFTVTKAAQTLSANNIAIPFETRGMRVVVSGDRTPLTYKVTATGGVITINENTGVIKTLRGGKTQVTIYATETAFFKPASKTINVEVTARALTVGGIQLVKTTSGDGIVYFYYGEPIDYEGVPYATLRDIEKAVPGWKYEYEGREGTTYTRSTSAPTAVGLYTLYITIFDENMQYTGTQEVPFEIMKAIPSLSGITAAPLTYMDKLTDSAISGTAVGPYITEEIPGTWTFADPDIVPHVTQSGVTQFRVIFTPAEAYQDRYATAEAFINLTINKATPGGVVTASCTSYTYGGITRPTIEIGNYTGTAIDDGSHPTQIKYYYSLVRPEFGTDGTVWRSAGQDTKEVEAGTYFMWAEIGSSDYVTTYTAITEFTVYKGIQTAPSFTMNEETMTVAKEDRGRALEYSVDGGTTWIAVPRLDGNGSFAIAGLNGNVTIQLRAAETNNYLASDATSQDANITKISVSYHPNRGLGSIAPTFAQGATTAALASTGFTREGYTFANWNTSPDGEGTTYAIGAEISVSTVLYAQWTANNYTVAFDPNGGEGTMPEQSFTYDKGDQSLSACAFTAPDNTTFAGWSTSPNGPVMFTDGYQTPNVVPEGTATLYAIWTETNTVSGNIYSCTNSSVTLTLKQGSDVIKTITVNSGFTSTDSALGQYTAPYSFEGVGSGLYNLVVEQELADGTKIITEDVYVSGSTTHDVVIKDSKVASVVVVEEGTRQIVVSGLNKEAEGKRADDKEVLLTMNLDAVVEQILPPTASQRDRDIQRDILAINAIRRTTELDYFNADIFMSVTIASVGSTTQIRNTHNVIEMVVPYDMTGVRSIQVYRSHDGNAIQLRQSNGGTDGTYWVDWENGLIHIFATKFSVYAIGVNAPEYYGGGGGVVKAKAGYRNCPKDETCPIEPFIDSINDAWYHDGVHFCIEEKLMVGRTTELFVPDGNISRAEIVTILWRAAGSPEVECELTYKDIIEGKYYYPALRWATKLGVVEGYDAEHFGPNDSITREQLAAILFRYAQIVDGENAQGPWNEFTFTDAAKIKNYAQNAVHWCVENGIIAGKADNTFDPQNNATRAESACMVQRFLNRDIAE